MRPKANRLCIALVSLWPALAMAENQTRASDVDLEEVMFALENRNMSAEEIRTTEALDGLEIVDLNDLQRGGNVEALQEMLRETEDGWAEVQAAIEANELFEQELERLSIDVGSVIAITRNDEGVVTAYLSDMLAGGSVQ